MCDLSTAGGSDPGSDASRPGPGGNAGHGDNRDKGGDNGVRPGPGKAPGGSPNGRGPGNKGPGAGGSDRGPSVDVDTQLGEHTALELLGICGLKHG